MIHGVIVSGRYLAPLGAALSRDFAVAIPDLPGYGLSHGARTLAELADAAVASADALGANRVRSWATALVLRSDRLVPAEWSQHVAGLLPDGRVTEIPVQGHMPHWSAPAAVASALRSFLSNNREA